MPHNNGIITAPVSIADVKAVLGESTNDLGALCTSKKIKKWSRRKPVKSYVLFNAKESDFKAANYGLKVPVLGGPFENCVDKIINRDPSTFWEYIQPSGSRNSPFRITDFEHYNHNASPPFPIPMKKGVHNFNLADGELKIAFELTVEETDIPGVQSYNVILSELTSSAGDLGDFRLAIAVRNPNSNAGTLRFESANKLGEDNGNIVKVKSNSLTQGFTYDCYPFLFKENAPGDFFVVPCDGLSFKMYCYNNEAGDLGGDDTKRPIIIDLNFVNGVVKGTVKIGNLTTKPISLTEARLRFFKYNDITGEEIVEAYWVWRAKIDLAAKGTVGDSKTFSIPGNDGEWEYGIQPQYDPNTETYVQFTSYQANSEIENVWLIS